MHESMEEIAVCVVIYPEGSQGLVIVTYCLRSQLMAETRCSVLQAYVVIAPDRDMVKQNSNNFALIRYITNELGLF